MTDKFVILSRDGCEYCEAAQALLPNAVILKDETARTIVKEGGFGTFPQIFHRGKHIGGFNELLEYRPDAS
ncbi:glutaredoxin domain-containing protein [Rhizobium sp. Leaf383]|uniref:glutaredoxin domain-containing protein n=1 Tax=Rhizobium sp. Leaf383 TaxID=1736357 RepID=UPI000713F373|nr:glutaredoxin domain-containing protein [Rhizobium sp. Leaf383]KQS84289.1 hypothetical protein ASG58_21195 [Rhizobium sp. Leaf383]